MSRICGLWAQIFGTNNLAIWIAVKIFHWICQNVSSESIWCDDHSQHCPTLDQGRFNATGSKAAKAQCHKCGIFPIFALLPEYLIGFAKIFGWNWQYISSLKLAKYFLQINLMERYPILDQGQSDASGFKVSKPQIGNWYFLWVAKMVIKILDDYSGLWKNN